MDFWNGEGRACVLRTGGILLLGWTDTFDKKAGVVKRTPLNSGAFQNLTQARDINIPTQFQALDSQCL